MLLHRERGNKLECLLCPHFCSIGVGERGICGARENTGKKIELMTYGLISGYSPDPVEKKPLYHFFPGHNILSVGSFGCNMRCDFCQNFGISQEVPKGTYQKMTPSDLVKSAGKAKNNIGIAFTYNEPVISFEFITDVAAMAKDEGLFTVIVSNGFINSGPLDELINLTDAFNIDLKAFNNDYYRRLTGASIEPVKSSLKQIAASGRHLEITTLIIPGKNDKTFEMKQQTEWIANELGRNVPLHISRYFPMYKRDDPVTTSDTLDKLFTVASENLTNVYLGNLNSGTGQNTICPNCGETVTKRRGYETELLHLNSEGNCIKCNTNIYKHFTLPRK